MTTPPTPPASRFRFRAWDYTHKQMIYDVGVVTPLGVAIPVRDIRDEGYFTFMPNSDVMQSTGLTDKNGKEIFEGDIVRFSSTWEGGQLIGQVILDEYNDGEQYRDYTHLGWVVRYRIGTCKDSRTLPDIRKYSEVIGNICQNPDLLP